MLAAFEGGPVVIEGRPSRVSAGTAVILSLVFGELITNAAEHGALSRSGAARMLSVSFRRADDCQRVAWRERCPARSPAPPDRPPRLPRLPRPQCPPGTATTCKNSYWR